MSWKTKSTHCRVCHQPGDLVRGVHLECRRVRHREWQRLKRGTDPSMFLASEDRPQVCVKCHSAPPEEKSRIGLCAGCYLDRKRELSRAWQSAHAAIEPRVCACGSKFKNLSSDQCWWCRNGFKRKAKPKRVVAEKPPPKPARKSPVKLVRPTLLPKNWNAPDPKKAQREPVSAVVLNPGVEVRRAPPLPGLRDLFGVHGEAHGASD